MRGGMEVGWKRGAEPWERSPRRNVRDVPSTQLPGTPCCATGHDQTHQQTEAGRCDSNNSWRPASSRWHATLMSTMQITCHVCDGPCVITDRARGL